MSCNSECGQNNYNHAIGFEIHVKSSNGEDLLNPNSPNTLNTSNIKLYYLKNGISEEVYNPNSDYPRNFMIFMDQEGLYRMRIFPNALKNEEFSVTYIKWNETDSDTVKCKFSFDCNATILQKVWFNDTLKLDTALGDGLFFEILK